MTKLFDKWATERIAWLSRRAEQKSPPRPWLPRDPSAAFVCCIGAGPWKYGRRRTIQLKGLTELAGRDLWDLAGNEKWFPLAWQNEMLNALTMFLKRNGRPVVNAACLPTLSEIVSKLRVWVPIEAARPTFYRMCGRPQGTKVLALYLRDFVGVPCFPVDRHVRRALQELGLPTKEEALLDLCDAAEVDPITIARMLGTDRLDGGNPDWSRWPEVQAPERST